MTPRGTAPRTPWLRLIAAWTVFAATVAAGLWGMLHLPHGGSSAAGRPGRAREAAAAPNRQPQRFAPKAPLGPTTGAKAEGDGGFFYEHVGHAPSWDDGREDEHEDGAPATPATTGVYTLEFKVCTSRTDAERVIEDLRHRGVEAYYTPLSRGGQVLFRVRRGFYATDRDAAREALALREAKGPVAKVVRLD